MDDSDRLSALRAELIKRLGRERYNLWLGPHTTFEVTSTSVRVGCASSFELQWLRRRTHNCVAECCRQLYGDSHKVEYFVRLSDPMPAAQPSSTMLQRSLLVDDPPSAATERAVASMPVVNRSVADKPALVAAKITNRPRRSAAARYSFKNFVVGACNELACRTAESVAAELGYYGPLLIHGPAGVGKTHLLYAIQRQVYTVEPGRRTLRLNAEQFTIEFLEALRQRTLPSFRQKFRSIDVLLVDDLQFLFGKQATLEELIVTIDFLHERGKQVVLAFDGSPQELRQKNAELAVRISGGLAVPLSLPDFATRRALVRQFIDEMHPVIGLSIDDETVTMIANQVAGSARQLQGAINRLVVTGEALHKPITLDLARTTLSEYVQQITPPVRLGDIQRAVCSVFGVDASSLKSTSKARKVAEPRMLAMWLACSLTRSALGEISEYFGRRSHSTVISAQKKIEKMVSRGDSMAVADLDCSVEEAIRRVRAVLRSA